MLFFKKYESVLLGMQLTVRDASTLLNLPEKKIYSMIKRNEIPFYRLNKLCLFNRAELLEWAISKSINISSDFFSPDNESDQQLPLLADAIQNGGIHYLGTTATKEEVLKTVVKLIPDLASSKSDLIYTALMARETLGSTAIGDGIAIPHVRNPIILNMNKPSILLCFLALPLDFGALDGKKVTTIFTMISPNARIHLHLLARLSYILQNSEIRAVLNRNREPAEILAAIRKVEAGIGLQINGTGGGIA